MRSPEAFDAFYAATRDQLLLECYALTGDLPAARSAVRDAFMVAWHHWHKVARLDDRAGWVRPLAHGRAQRRHSTRPWHREKDLDVEVQATLDALSKLSGPERKVLALTTLSPMSMVDIAREAGLPRTEAERVLQAATTHVALSLDVASTDVRPLLEALRGPIADSRWPRSTIVRRSGTARRRGHTLVGAAAVVAAMLISGTVVIQGSGGAEPSSLAQERAMPGVTLHTDSPDNSDDLEAAPELDAGSLLSADQVSRFDPRLTWTEGETSDNLAGSGLVMPCQQTRFADPEGAGALMRTFSGSSVDTKTRRTRRDPTTRSGTQERATAIEFVEMSADPAQAQEAFAVSRGWYSGCLDSRTQLLSTQVAKGVGDEAVVMTLRTWKKVPARIAVGVARTGATTITTLTRSTGSATDARAVATGLAAAVNAVCGTANAGTCAGPPKLRTVAPYAAGKAPGMLATVDLPTVRGAVGPWVGTDPERARVNFAATRCDNTEFRGPGRKRVLTRTFLFLAKKKADTFGLTQTIAVMKAQEAGGFVEEVRKRMDRCGTDNLGATVESLVHRSSAVEDLDVWQLDMAVSDERTVSFWMAIMRNGKAVSQVGFTPSDAMSMQQADFVAVAERALERLSGLPGAKR